MIQIFSYSEYVILASLPPRMQSNDFVMQLEIHEILQGRLLTRAWYWACTVGDENAQVTYLARTVTKIIGHLHIDVSNICERDFRWKAVWSWVHFQCYTLN